MNNEGPIDASAICFGLNRREDEQSLTRFLKLICQDEVTEVLIPRMSDDEISRTVEYFTELMRNHLTKKEYHALVLGEKGHP